jgi:hypothetical protein
MRIFASPAMRIAKLGLAPCFVLGLLVGCDSSSGPGIAQPAKDGQVTATKVEPLSPAEKRKMKGGVRAAAGVDPSSP